MRCLNGLDKGMYHNPYVLLLCPFNISFLSLIIFISFLSKMAIKSLSHSWTNEIREALCIPSKMCAFFRGCLDFLIVG